MQPTVGLAPQPRGARKPWNAWFTPWPVRPAVALRPGCPELLATGVPWPNGIELWIPRRATQRGVAGVAGARPADTGLPSWNLGLVNRGPATTDTSPLPSRGRGGFGLLAWECFKLSPSKTTTRLATTRSGHQSCRPRGWSQKRWGESQAWSLYSCHAHKTHPPRALSGVWGGGDSARGMHEQNWTEGRARPQGLWCGRQGEGPAWEAEAHLPGTNRTQTQGGPWLPVGGSGLCPQNRGLHSQGPGEAPPT